MKWFIFALLAVTIFGVQSFFYKIAMQKGCNKYFLISIFMSTVAVLGFVRFIIEGAKITALQITILFGILSAIAFLLRTGGLMKALEYLPTNIVFPIELSNIVFVVIFSLIFLDESLTLLQLIGIITILGAVLFMHSNSKKSKHYKIKKVGFIAVTISVLAGSTQDIIAKFAASKTEIVFFLFVFYLSASAISWIIYNAYKIKTKKEHKAKKYSLKFGLLIGTLNFFGVSSLLYSLKTGPLSLISPMLAIGVMVVIILSRIILKEELSMKQLALVVLTIIGVILLKV